MSQATLGTIDPAATSGTQLAAALSAFGQAIESCHRGASRPSYAVSGMIWVREVSASEWGVEIFDGVADRRLLTVNPQTGAVTVPGASLDPGEVTEPILADGAVSARALGDGVVGLANIDQSVLSNAGAARLMTGAASGVANNYPIFDAAGGLADSGRKLSGAVDLTQDPNDIAARATIEARIQAVAASTLVTARQIASPDIIANSTNANTSIASANGFNLRALNEVQKNTLAGATVATYLYLQPGTYFIDGFAVASASGGHIARLWDVGASTVVVDGSATFSYNTNEATLTSHFSGEFTFASSVALGVYSMISVANGLGLSVGHAPHPAGGDLRKAQVRVWSLQ